MAEYTVVAYNWTSNGYNATYNTSHSATFTDDDESYQGSGDSGETVSIDGGAAGSTSGSPYSIDVSFTDPEGAPHVETFYFFNTDGEWYFIPGEDSEFEDGSTLGNYQNHTVGWYFESVVCFADGTEISTLYGPKSVEELEPGAKILTLDGGYKTLRLNLKRKISKRELRANPKLRPVRIERGALGSGSPSRDLWVSRQHRMLVSSPISLRMFGATDALIPAIKLVECPGCDVDFEREDLTYCHLVFDQHEVIFANGAPAESFYAGPEAMKAIPAKSKQEFLQFFGSATLEPSWPKHARLVPEGHLQKKLIARHLKNKKPFVEGNFITHQISDAQDLG